MLEYKVTGDAAGQRLDKFLRKRLTTVPLSHLYKMVRTKKVRVNGARGDIAQLLAEGDVISIRGPEAQLLGPPPPPEFREGSVHAAKAIRQDFKVLYEDEHIVVVENEPTVHNVVVCTLCSCYPWPVLGLPPSWYKDPAYRSRVVREPRKLLAEMGLELGADVAIRVWDSSAENRYVVLPMRPAGTDDLSEEELAALVTRDAMVGVALVSAA